MKRAISRGMVAGLAGLVAVGLNTATVFGQAGSVDATFDTGGGPNDVVYALALQANGQILVGGDFTAINEAPALRLLRLTTSGATDVNFAFPGANDSVYAIAVHPGTGRIVIGGDFTDIGGHVAQLLPDGSLDPDFAPTGGANGTVYAVSVYSSGTNSRKVLIGGYFNLVNGTSRPFLARLNSDGSLDTGFSAGIGPNGPIYAIRIQPDDKVIIGGAFTTVNGTNRLHIARLNPDGSLDTSFNPGTGANDTVLALARQTDGKILLGGLFTKVNGITRNSLARLNPDGALDTTFLDGQAGAEDYVSSIALQSDGKVVIGGGFTYVNGLNRNRFARLNTDGTLDTTINIGSGADDFLWSVLVDSAGRFLIGGGFSSFNDTTLNYVGRLNGGALTNNGQFVLSSANYSIAEYGGQIAITVRRLGGLNGSVSVVYLANTGTAVPGVDYIPTSGVLNFLPGEDTQSFVITILDDQVLDGDKTVDLVLTTPTGGATLGNPTTATLAILDDDSIIGFSQSSYMVFEGDGILTVTMNRAGSTLDGVYVNFETIQGTALAGLDYSPTNGTNFFAPGQNTATFEVAIIDDSLIGEGNETVTLKLSGATNTLGSNILGQATATVVIVDNDLGPGMLEFSVDSYSAFEDEGSVTVNVVRRNGNNGVVSVSYATSNGSATNGLDYVGRTNSMSFPAGVTSRSFTIPIINDSSREGTETFSLRLFNPTGGASLGRTNATVRILDDDFSSSATGGFALDSSSYTVNEGDGSVVIMVRRVNGTNGTASVNYATAGNSALSPQDFQFTSGVLVFQGGERTKTFSVPILNDTLAENTESFTVRLSNPTNAFLSSPSQAAVSIIDDDIGPGSLGLLPTEFTVWEGATNLVITVVRTNGLRGPVGVTLSTADDTAVDGTDYVGTNVFLYFADGQVSTNITIGLIDNSDTNDNKRFVVNLSHPTNGATLLEGYTSAAVRILDNDYVEGEPGVFSFMSPTYSVMENEGMVTLTIIRQWGKDGALNLVWSTRDGSARAGRDYTGITTNQVAFSNGVTSRTISVPILDNTLLDGSREFSVRLLTNGITNGATLYLDQATVTIMDDDPKWGDIRFVTQQISVGEEEGSATITVGRYGGNVGTVSVDYATSDGTAVGGVDFTNAVGTLVFPPGGTTLRSFTVPITNDALTNGTRTVNLSLTKISYEATNAPGGPSVSVPSAVLTIYDDESVLTPGGPGGAGQLQFNRASYSAALYDVVRIAVTRTGGTRGQVLVDYQVIDTTGAVVDRGTLTFNDSQTSAEFWVLAEDTTLTLQLINPRPATGESLPKLGTPSSALLRAYDWTAGFNFVYSVAEVSESSVSRSVRLWVSRDFNSSGAVSVSWETFSCAYNLQAGSDYAASGEDYTARSGTLNWAADDFGDKPIDIPILDDAKVEFNEDFFVRLRNPSGTGTSLGMVSVATVTIVEDYQNEQPAGAVDLYWNPDLSGNVVEPNPPFNSAPGANSRVYALALQSDGRMLLGGDFTGYNAASRNRIARTEPDGGIDLSFDPGTGADGYVGTIVLYPEGSQQGKILVGGGFTSFNGQNRYRVARLNADGSLDTTFRPGAGANGPVRAAVIQSNGRAIIAGEFTLFDGTVRNHIARLNIDGSLDTSFNPGLGADGPVYALALSGPNEQVIIAGDFQTVNGQPRSAIARLNSSGSLDAGFDTGGGVNGAVYGVAVQPDGKVIMGGDFTQINFTSRSRIARLNADGRVDVTFDPGTGFNNTLYAVTLQPDGRPLVGGLFTSYNGTRRVCLARLLPNGVLDTSFMDTAYNQFAGLPITFSYDPPNYVSALAYQTVDTNEWVFIGGSFARVGGGYTRDDVRSRSNIARLVGGETPGPGNIEFTRDNYGADEAAGSAEFILQRVNGRLGPAAVSYSTVSGSAQAGSDFQPISSGSASWGVNGCKLSDGDYGSRVNALTIFNDTLVEGNELFSVVLSVPTNTLFLGGVPIPLGLALGRPKATVTIIDDDFARGVLGFTAPTLTVDENGVQATITVTRTNGSTGVVSVDYSTASPPAGPGAATAISDYTPVSGTLTFASGETNKTFVVPIVDDITVEPDETIYLRLSLPTGGATIGLGAASLIIVDNDFQPGRLNFSASDFRVRENAGSALVTVNRFGGNKGLLSVQVTTSDGTATGGLDYVPVTTTLTWSGGDSAPKSVTIPILNDSIVDPAETIQLQLSNPSVNGALGSVTNATLTIDDDDAYGTFVFSASSYIVNENGGKVTITVLRTNGSAETATVRFATSDWSTNAPGTFVRTNGQLTFANGETAKTFDVIILDNITADDTEFVTLTLSSPQPVGARLGSPSQVSLAIIDDELVNVPAGAVDTTFYPNPGVDGPVYAMALQSNGRLLIGGDFSFVNGTGRPRLARLLSNGLLDSTFEPGTGANGSVRTMALQNNGRVVVGGFFTTINDVPRHFIARQNTDGTVDSSFNPGSGFDNPVYALTIQRIDNQEKVVVGGGFTAFNGVGRSFVARLLDNGLLDAGFDPGPGPNNTVFAVAAQPDGKVLIGGDFTTVSNTNRVRLARLNADGSLDLSFDPGLGPNGSVRTIAVQSDGKILLGGLFTQINGTNWNHIARLNADGSLDASFNPGPGADNLVYALALQTDGKIVVGGDFTRCNGVTRNRITRLNADGTVDPTINFGTGANGFVASVLVQADGKLVIGGGFTTYNGVTRNRVARIHGRALSGSGSLEFSAPEYTILENGNQASITVLRTGGTEGQVSVQYFTAPGTASPGDYTEVSGTLTFPTGETLQSFVVPVFDNQQVNPDKSVRLILTNFNGAAIGPQPTATLTILNDDSLVSFENTSYSVNENAVGGRAYITVTRTGATNGTVWVDYATAATGTATPNADYRPASGTLVFSPGQSTRTFTVTILNDQLMEGNEILGLTLLNPSSSVVLGLNSVTLNIVDNDFAPGQLVFSSPIYFVNENGGSVTVTIVRTNGTTGIVSAQYATSDGTAQAGLDYGAVTGILAFADGQVSNTFTIPIIWDTVVETDETVNLRLFNPTGGALLGSPSTAVLVIGNVGGYPLPGTVNADFNAGQGANNFVLSMSVQSDGRLVIGGAFTQFDGTNRNYIARLSADGTLDSGFNPGDGASALVWSTALQPDAKVLLGGAFLKVNNISRTRIARLASSGVLDIGFNPGGVNAIVYAVAPHGAGVLLGGAFDDAGSTNIARLNADGSLDSSFNSGLVVDGPVYALAVLPDNRVILAGDFRKVNGTNRGSIARLSANGKLDTSFGTETGVGGSVFSVALQANGQMVIGGWFASVNGATNQNNVARLNADGSLDASFAPISGADGAVYSVVVQSDNKVLIGGDFTQVNGFSRNRIARLMPDGLVDQNFAVGSGADGTVYAVGLQPDQRVVIAGDFTYVDGQRHNRVAQLLGGDPFNPAGMRFLAITSRPNGDVLITLQSQPGHIYALDVSADFQNWALFDVKSAVGNTLTFIDTSAPGQRFYRARRVGP